jgi:hypothetical protein
MNFLFNNFVYNINKSYKLLVEIMSIILTIKFIGQ